MNVDMLPATCGDCFFFESMEDFQRGFKTAYDSGHTTWEQDRERWDTPFVGFCLRHPPVMCCSPYDEPAGLVVDTRSFRRGCGDGIKRTDA